MLPPGMAAGHDQRRPARARAEALIRAPHRSVVAVVLAVAAGSLAQLGFALFWRSADTFGWNGITGVAGVLVPIVVAILVGRWPGAIVGLVGGVLFVVLVAPHAPREPVAGGAVVIALWAAVPVAVGGAFDSLRKGLSSTFEELEHARDVAQRSERET